MRFANLLLVGGLFIVGVLVWTKEDSHPSRSAKPAHKQITRSVPAPELPHEVLSSGAHLMRRPISKEEFARFVETSGYRTWREERGLEPTWQAGAAGEDVIWLMPADASAYGHWLGKLRAGLQFRLPTVKELEQAQGSQSWEWTQDTLYDSDPSRELHKSYQTAWHPEQGARHRRPRDLVGTEAVPTRFRLAWE